MNEGGWAEAATAVRRYHALSKHHPRHYAPGPGGLDWANQPNPFRRFKGSSVVPLPLVSGEGMLAYDHLFRPARGVGFAARRAVAGPVLRTELGPQRLEGVRTQPLGAPQ